MLVKRKESALAAFTRLYASDAMFRSSLDFAAIGFAVYLFVAPLPLRSLWNDVPSSKVSNPGGTSAASHTTPILPTGIAQAANSSGGTAAGGRLKLDRNWLKLSDASITPQLSRAFDEVDARRRTSALEILDKIDRPDDPNVLWLRAICFALEGSKSSMASSLELLIKAGDAGHPDAMNEAGQYLRLGAAGRTDIAEAVRWYERGAAAGSAAAAANAGRAYVNGWARTNDPVKAYHYYQQAAEGGNKWGMHNLAGMLINESSGIERNPKEGRAWMEKAARAGLTAAKLDLAEISRKGVGGPVDIDAYIEWAEQAANDGYAPALYSLGMYFLEPDAGKPADVVRAAGYLRQAATKKHAPAQFAYATLSERGVGMPANLTQAFIYYSLALRGGEKAAEERLSALRNRMTEHDIEAAQRLVAAST